MVDDGTNALRPARGRGSFDGSETLRLRREHEGSRCHRARAAEAVGDADVGAGLIRPLRGGCPNRGRRGGAQAKGVTRSIADEVSGDDRQEQAGGGPRGYGSTATGPSNPATSHRGTR
jgi:hypothetical protein